VTKKEKTRKAILGVLNEIQKPAGAAKIRAALLAAGMDIQPRTIRLHLLELDHEGLSTQVSRRLGRIISKQGREELSRSNVIEKVGLIASRVDNLSYRMSFHPSRKCGTVVLNISLIQPEHVSRALHEMKLVFRHKLAISPRIMVAHSGEVMAGIVIPENYSAIGTICSVTVSGALLREGVSAKTRFSGLLEVRDRIPIRFVDLIEYAGTTLDPLEIFIQANMTNVRGVIQTGNGILCAGFREIPAAALEDVKAMSRKMLSIGLGGILELGQPNQPVLGVRVSEGHAGMIVYGGLNPIAAVRESGVPVIIKPMAGLEEYSALRTIEEYQRKPSQVRQNEDR